MRLRLVALVLLALPVSGCSMAMLTPVHPETPPAPAALVVEVTGTPGIAFEGSLGTPQATRAIAGQAPLRFTVTTAVAVDVTVTKEQEAGELTVRVLRAGQEVARRTTIAPYGTVLLVYRP